MLMWVGMLLLSGLEPSKRAAPPLPPPAPGQAPIVTLPLPTVVSTSPSSGAVVEPGPIEVSVTFDVPMQAESYSFVQRSGDTFPTCPTRPVQSSDRRTFTLRCEAAPNRNYEIWFNRPPYMNFKSEKGAPATPFKLLFRTADS